MIKATLLFILAAASLLFPQNFLDTLSVNSWHPQRLTGVFPASGGDVHAACDSAGNFYMFGGCTYGNGAGLSHNNDVYRFNVRTGESVKLSYCGSNGLNYKGGCQAGHAYDSRRDAIYTTNGAAATCGTGRSAGLFRFQCPDGPLDSVGDIGSHYLSYDPVNDKLYIAGGSAVFVYDCSLKVYCDTANYPFGSVNAWDMACCADSKRGLFVITLVGPYANQALTAGVTRVYFYDPRTSGWTFNTPAATPPFTQWELDYDPVNDKYVYFGSGGTVSEVWAYDHDANLWTKMPENGRRYDDAIDKYANRWPAVRHKHSWCYDPKDKVFVNWGGGQWAASAYTDYSNPGNCPLWVYKPMPYDTGRIDRIELYSATTRFEQFRSTPFTVTVFYQGGSSAEVTSFCGFSVNPPERASAFSGSVLTGLLPGPVMLTANYWGFTDSLEYAIDSTALDPDSLVLSPESLAIMAGDTFTVTATCWYHVGADLFHQPLNALASWGSDAAAVSVSSGFVQGVSAGSAVVTASCKGASDRSFFKVMPRPSVIYRINFGCSNASPKYGWLGDNGQSFDATRGWGWTTGSRDCRGDRDGNVLLRSFVNVTSPANFRMDVPDGNYLVRLAMGDNQYNSASTYYWIAQGADTLLRHSGRTNTIVDAAVTVSGGQGLNLTVMGCVNYLVLISDEGITLPEVADDFQTGGFSGIASGQGFGDLLAPFSLRPNPFNPAVTIDLGNASKTSVVRIYDLSGRKVASFKPCGRAVTWDARRMPSGAYLVRVDFGGKKLIKRAMLIR